ncbi:hypothetical protein LTS18_011620, partial [Coniosporium uncinatum]
KPRTGSSQTHAESPLRKTSFPAEDLQRGLAASKAGGKHDHALESEAEDDDDATVHIDPPTSRSSKIGGGGYDPPTEDLGPRGGNTEQEGGFITEEGYGAPILASDEVARHPESVYLMPAVDPEQERIRNEYYAGVDSQGNPVYQSGRRNSSFSRPQSRNNGAQQETHHPLQRYTSNEPSHGTSTPLDNVKEYEPLFPSDDEEDPRKPKLKRAVGHADKLKRPDLARHHFPSQDIWEDTPSSLMYSTTIETPPPVEQPTEATLPDKPAAGFETPESEAARKQNLTDKDQESFLSEHTKKFAKSRFNKDVLGDMPTRPGMRQRFPSQDIWEDTPDHHQLMNTTTIQTPPPADEPMSATSDGKPELPSPTGQQQTAQPTISARPARTREVQAESSTEAAKAAPSIPERPNKSKPQVPARPAKPLARGSQEEVPLQKVTSAGSVGSESNTMTSPPVPKAKPAVPARPGGGKIAALQAGFIKDLNSKLGLGPPKAPEPKDEEKVEEEEKAPLVDARKGRVRGPQRRKPGVSPSAGVAGAAAGDEQPAKAGLGFSIASPWTMWTVGEEGELEVGASSGGATATKM